MFYTNSEIFRQSAYSIIKDVTNSESSEDVTSSEDSISDSPLDRSADRGFTVTVGAGGGGGSAGTSGGNGGVGSAIRNGAGMFILFIKCRTCIRELQSIWLLFVVSSTQNKHTEKSYIGW